MQMRSHKPFGALILSVAVTFSAAASARASATPERSCVAVVTHPPQVTVRVSRPTELATILQDLCHQVRASCQIAEGAVAGIVAPVTVTGTWLEVIAGLLQETGVNFLATPAGPGLAARLVIIPGPARAKDTARGSPKASGAIATEGPGADSVESVVPDLATGSSTRKGLSDQAEETIEPAAGAPFGLAGMPPGTPESSVGAAGVSVGSAADPSVIWSGGVGPFPGGNTAPSGIGTAGVIPQIAASSVGAPFPDPAGNPLPMAPLAAPAGAVPSGAPFPDSDGNPLPFRTPGAGASHGNPPNPFPDPRGAPIVSPTPPPGLHD